MMKNTQASFFENKTITFLILLLPAALVYAKSLAFDFTSMDEQWMIVKDADFLSKWKNIKVTFQQPTAEVYYRPLFMISLITDFHLAKLSPFIYHFTNLCLHLFCVALLYQFLVLIKADKKAALLFSVLFSVHPVLLHAVAWIPGRNDLMLGVFTLLAFIYLLKYLSELKAKFLILHLLFFICALFTKENAIVLPFIFMFL
jgi:hypothetical protein